MRSSLISFLVLLAAAPLLADPQPSVPLSPGQVLPTATTTPTPMSTPAVTPDARFSVPEYSVKWPHISLEEAQRLHARKDVLFVDGRARVEWEQSHIPGALSIPVGQFDENYKKFKSKIKRAKIIVSYCHGEGCRLSDMLAQHFINQGHHNVAVFWGGFPAWDGAKLPLSDKNGKPYHPQPAAPPQPMPTPVKAP